MRVAIICTLLFFAVTNIYGEVVDKPQQVTIYKSSSIVEGIPKYVWEEEFLRELSTRYYLGHICGNEHCEITGMLYVDSPFPLQSTINWSKVEITSTFYTHYGNMYLIPSSVTIDFKYEYEGSQFNLRLTKFDKCYRLVTGQWWRTTEAFFRFYLLGVVRELHTIERFYPPHTVKRHWPAYIVPQNWFIIEQQTLFKMLLLDDKDPNLMDEAIDHYLKV